jgi:hypothetical protein
MQQQNRFSEELIAGHLMALSAMAQEGDLVALS